MIVKKTKQLGNFKKGIDLYIPTRRNSSTQSGLPVASTNSILINGVQYNKTNYWGEGTLISGAIYADPNSNNYNVLFAPNTTWQYSDGEIFTGNPFGGNPSRWELVFAIDFGDNVWTAQTVAYNASTNGNYIPTSSWVPSTTITAA
jgi:hypothetical protein